MGNPIEKLLAPKFSVISPTNKKTTPQKELTSTSNQFNFQQKYSTNYIQNLKEKAEKVNSFPNKLKNFLGCGEKLTNQEKKILEANRQPKVPQLMPQDTKQPE